MKNLTKIGIGVSIICAFIAGAFIFNAINAGAFGWGKHKENSEEWQAKMEEFKAMSSEEMQEYKKECMEEGSCSRLFGSKNHFDYLKGFGDEVNYDIEILENGVQITVTSDDSNVVVKLQGLGEKMQNKFEE